MLVTSVSGGCLLLSLHPTFLYFFISTFMFLVLASPIGLLFLPLLFYLLLLSFARKNADKEFNDRAQFQCRPEGDNIQFNSTVVINSMYLKQQSGWRVPESNPDGREFFCNRLD